MSQVQILASLKAGTISIEDASKLLEALNASKPATPLYCKVSDKGAISLYGLMVRFPVTLYAGQWQRLFDYVDSIKAFIKENEKHPAVLQAEKDKDAKKAAAKAAAEAAKKAA